ncbi:MAG: GTPase ObgE [Candidatus Nealsonbacteria bacterium]|nr:GTPase ObgE [Candidatus Nealsonbacteria bacterium]
MPVKLYKTFMLIDDVKIKVTAGSGGKGTVAFNKNMMALGPVGGGGGKGGSIYIEGVSDLSALNQFRFKKEIKAKDGQDGRSQFRDGNNADDLILFVPVGTVAHNLNTGEDVEITKIGQRAVIVRGGRGGRGNFHFRSATNTTPKEFEYGRPGESLEIHFELKLIADVGFVGTPNVGKSSLLNELTNAKSKVANYPFTTLEPNLGVYYDLILADIPGLIEGASMGKGLGIKFLRHIERTKTLFHFVAADSANPVADYKTVRSELGAYNKLLLEKPEYVLVSKKDVVSPDIAREVVENLEELNKNTTPISIFDWDSIKLVKKILNDLILEKTEQKS